MDNTMKTWSTPTLALKIERFERRPGGSTECWSAFAERRWRTDLGTARTSLVAVRAIREAAGWRLDIAEAVAGAWMPWEPLSQEVFPTRTAATAVLRSWRRAALAK